MAHLIALDQVRDGRFESGGAEGGVWQTFFLRPPAGSVDPQAFLVEYRPGRTLVTHFHDSDEFQLVVAGGGTLGRHVLRPGTLHFARAYTPYGPIVAGDSGLAFLTLRARRDSLGPQKLPERRAQLESHADRQRWQATDELPPRSDANGLVPLSGLQGPPGLLACCIDLAAGATLQAPPASDDGQFVVLLAGLLQEDAREVAALSLAFVRQGDSPLPAVAGADGARVLCLGFPET
jgi:hypothetical protein